MEGYPSAYHLTSRIDAAKIVGADPFRWYRNYALPVRDDLRYEFAEVFLETHSYAATEPLIDQTDKSRSTGRFTSSYRECRDAYRQGNTAPADELLSQYADVNSSQFRSLEGELVRLLNKSKRILNIIERIDLHLSVTCPPVPDARHVSRHSTRVIQFGCGNIEMQLQPFRH